MVRMVGRLGAWACGLGLLAGAAWFWGGQQVAEPASFAAPIVVPVVFAPAFDDGDAPGAPSAPSGAGVSTVASTIASSPASTSTAPLLAGDASLASAGWAAGVALATGIPTRAVLGYAGAALRLASEDPTCRLGWTTLAALGAIESGHGTHAGSGLGEDGIVRPAILGPLLDGGSFGAVADTDQGRLDGNAVFDAAVGPLQFIPSTWERWGADGSGDGQADPQQIDDAALAAGRYLCHSGDLSVPELWRSSIFAYNHVDSYVDAVAATANAYAAQAG